MFERLRRQGPWRGRQRRVFVRPTARGWQAVFFGVLSLVVALLIGTTQIYQLAYALAGLLLVSLALGLFLSRGLRYERRIAEGERLTAGRPTHLELVVSNASRRRSPDVEMVDHIPQRRIFKTPPIKGAASRIVREPMLFEKRGRHELGPAEVRTVDPFGLLRFTRRFGERTGVTVYPEVFELASLPLRGSSRETGIRGSFAQHGDEFSGLREYRRGDDRRHIHWKSVARTGELVVKEFTQEAPQRHTVILDLYRPGIGSSEAEVEDAVSVAGSVLLYLSREGLPSRLLCSDKARGTSAFGADEAAYWRAMDLLAVAQADGETKPGDFLDDKLRGGSVAEKLGDGVVLISRSLDEGLVESVERLRTAGLTIVVVTLAAHTYRSGGSGQPSGASSGREAAFSEAAQRLEHAGADVRVVRRPGGLADFAGGQRAANPRGTRGMV